MFTPSLIETLHRHSTFPRQSWSLAGAITLQELAPRLALLALPFYLYRHGSPFSMLQWFPSEALLQGLVSVSTFLAVLSLARLVVSPLYLLTVKRFGVTNAMMVGAFILSAGFFALSFLETHLSIFFVAATLLGAGTFFFQTSARLLLFAEFVKKKSVEMSGPEFLTKLLFALAPLFGATLATTASFSHLFLTLSLISFCSGVLCLQVPLLTTKSPTSWLEHFSHLGHFSPLKHLLLLSQSFETLAQTLFWPLFLLLTHQSLSRVGYIYAIGGFLAIMILYTIAQPGTRVFRWLQSHSLQALSSAFLWMLRFISVLQPLSLSLLESLETIRPQSHPPLNKKSALFESIFQAELISAIQLSFLALCCAGLALVSWSWPAFIAVLAFLHLLAFITSSRMKA